VRQSQLEDAIDRVWSGLDAAGHDQHVTMVPKRVIFGRPPSAGCGPQAVDA
jgi:hypothetical protein